MYVTFWYVYVVWYVYVTRNGGRTAILVPLTLQKVPLLKILTKTLILLQTAKDAVIAMPKFKLYFQSGQISFRE